MTIAKGMLDSSLRLKIVSFVLMTVLFAGGFFARFSPGVMSNQIASDISSAVSTLSVATGLYFYFYTAFQVPAGTWVDRRGPVAPFVIGTSVSALGVAVSGLASSTWEFAVGSSIVGIGSAPSMLGVMRAAALWFSSKILGLTSGIALLVGNLGSAASGAPLSVLLDTTSWRTVLYCLAAFLFIGSILLWTLSRTLPKRSTEPTKYETNRLAPILTSPLIYFLAIVTVGTNSTFYAFEGLWGVPYLSEHGVSTSSASLWISIAMFVYSVMSAISGKLADSRLNNYIILVAISAISVLGWIVLAIFPSSFFGIGISMAGASAGSVIVAFTIVSKEYPASRAGTALAIVNASVFFFVAVIQQIIGIIWKDGSGAQSAVALLVSIALASLIAASVACMNISRGA